MKEKHFLQREINNNKKVLAEFFRQTRENQKDSLLNDIELMHHMGELLSEFRHQELLLNYCLLLGPGP